MLVHCVPLKAMLLNGNLGQSGIMEQALLHFLLEVLVSLFSGVQVLVLHPLVHGLQTGDALQSVLFVKGLIHKGLAEFQHHRYKVPHNPGLDSCEVRKGVMLGLWVAEGGEVDSPELIA